MSGPDASPYTPPSAELRGGAPPPEGGRWLWKLYFGLLALLLLLMFPLFGTSWMQALDLADLALTAVGLAGLFGYAFRTALGSRAFWRAWLPFEIAWDAAIAFLFEPAGLAYRLPDAEVTSTGDALLGYLFILPLYLALFRYAWRSPELWRAA